MTALKDMTLPELLAEQGQIEGMAALAASSKKDLQAELDRRFGLGHAAALKNMGKEYGTRTEVLIGGLRLKADTRKGKTEWDQGKLWAFAADLTHEELEHYCKIELTPKEAVYKALEPKSNVKGVLADARTDHPSTGTTYTLLAEGEK